jgi:hypothetical protein
MTGTARTSTLETSQCFGGRLNYQYQPDEEASKR